MQQQQQPPMQQPPPPQSLLRRPNHPPPPPPAVPQKRLTCGLGGYDVTDHQFFGQPDLQIHHNQHNMQQVVSDNLISDQVSNSHDDKTEEVIEAILAAKDALEKRIEERNCQDIILIDKLCHLMHAFDSFPETVRRALAAQAVLIVIDEKGKILICHNEELDSFCVLIFGECEQLDVTKTVPIRLFHVGDSFGIREPTTATIRFSGYMVTRCENCAFLCVKKDDYYNIVTDPANYPTKKNMRPDCHIIVRATEACLIMSLVDGYDQIDPSYVDDFLLLFRVFMTQDQNDKEIKIPPGMTKLCLYLLRWLDYISYRDKVVKILLTWLSSYYHDFELNSDFSYLFYKVLESKLLNATMNSQLHLLHATLTAKAKVRHVIISRSSREQPLAFSISGGYEKNCGIFITRVRGLNCKDPYESFMNYSRLPAGQITLPLKPGDQILEANGANFAAINLVEAHKKLNMSSHLSLIVKYNPLAYHEMLALPEGRRKSSVSSEPLPPPSPSSTNGERGFGFRSLIRSSPSILNAASIAHGSNHIGVNVIKVINASNNDTKYLLIHQETTAREVVMVAVKEFGLDTGSISSLNWHLYEVSVVPESKAVKQKCLSEQTSRLAENASLCSRFYIKNNSQNSRLDMGDDTLVNEILKESPAHVTITSLNATLLAVELTLADFNKFKSIEPQQFVYDTFFNSSTTPKSWTKEYHEFADISNREMFWVVCEILNERNIDRRVKIVKQFVRVADVCYQLKNYNSMFAIISGLGNSCVNRLRRTYEKLKPKYKDQLEKMRTLFDPSKNMSNYRMCISQIQPPAIPLFPQIKKDLTFSREGRSILVSESDAEQNDDTTNGQYSQDTIKASKHNPPEVINYKPYNGGRAAAGAASDNILVNFAEIRQLAERVRNVIYFSSVPYSNDLLTKDNQRNQTQIKKMHEEWQMRKRIRHYINQTLVNPAIKISYDERALYKKSLDIEPELSSSGGTAKAQIEKVPPVMIPEDLQQSSPTISKSSSCSSFNHHLPLVGRFGTESTENLRKLQALRENSAW